MVLVDDDLAFSDALGLALSMTPALDVIGRAPDASSAQQVVLQRRPDLLITDYRLEGSGSGADCIRDLREAGFRSPAVVLTGFAAPQVQREVDALPRTVLLSKRERVTTLIDRFLAVLDGSYRPDFADGAAVLSDGELEVLERINAGSAAAHVASELSLSIHTVRSRMKSLMRKLEVSSQMEAVAVATRRGLLVPPS